MRRSVLVSVLVWSLGACSAPEAPTAPGVAIEVDATAPGRALEPVWSYFGYDEANYTTTAEGKELLGVLAASSSAPVYTRTHFLFNSGDGRAALKWGSTNMYTEDESGAAVYDYTLLDQIMDATVESGARPFFELGFMPKALSTRPEPYENSSTYTLDGGSFYPPRDYGKWGALVGAWAEHAKQRYPEAEKTWQWELWNEPDLPYWEGTPEEYNQLYDYTEAALHAVLPEAPLGGPAVAGGGSLFFRKFLEHCAVGTNALTGKTGTRLDLVSFHAKGGVSVKDGHVQLGLGNQLRLHRAGFQAVKAWPQLEGTPIVISEADPDGCAACPVSLKAANAYRTSPAYGAYVAAMMKRSLQLAEQEGVSLRGVLTWAFTFPEAPYFAGYRELSSHGVHLPVLNAFKLLGALRGAQLPVVSSGALPLEEILIKSVREEAEVDGIAALDGDVVRILVWNYHDDLVPAEPVRVTLRVQLPSAYAARAQITHTRVDAEHGDAFATWAKQGSPETPSASQLDELHQAMQPVELEAGRLVEVVGGRATLSFELPRFGLSLVELAPAP
ncbi:MAG: beta-xylosidase [Myxococcales bacterium]|nr:MAG: beta-xylosidase [Myxococcales bacterium]